MDEKMTDAEEEVITTLANPEIIDKYKIAATITNSAMAFVASKCVPGASIVDICQAGDDFITEESQKVANKHKKIVKGVAFPTCLSANNTVANFSPLRMDPNVILQEGDVLKIDLGAHIDGIMSQMGHTIIVTSNPAQPVTGRKADAICAAHFAGECALRLCRPGNKASQITEVIKSVADVFKCNPVEGFHSYQVDRYVTAGEKSIPNRAPSDEKEKQKDFTFEENETYIIDILISTGEGKTKGGDVKTTVFQKNENFQGCKMKASRYLLTEVETRYKKMPFSLRSMDEKRARLGMSECLKAELMDEFPVVFEREGEFVAQFKFTVLLLPNSIQKLNAFNLPYVTSEYNIVDPQLQAILSMGLKRKSNASKNKKKKKKKTATATMSDN